MRAPVTVWPTPYVYAWSGEPTTAQGQPIPEHPTGPLEEALAVRFPSDAHVWPGCVRRPDGEIESSIPRLKVQGLSRLETLGCQVLITAYFVDVDHAGVHKEGAEAPQAWREQVRQVVDGLGLPAPAWYDTRGGMRFVWAAETPQRVQDALATLKTLRAVLRAALGAVPQTKVDELVDWGRCFRLPFVTRDGKPQARAHGRLDAVPDLSSAQVEALAPQGFFAQIGQTPDRGRGFQLPERVVENRNQTLAKYAGKLRRAGLEADEIEDLLVRANEQRCDPPLPFHEVAHIARSVARYDPAHPQEEPPPPPPPLTIHDAVDAPLANFDADRDYESVVTAQHGQPVFALGSEGEIAYRLRASLEDGGVLSFDLGTLWRYSTARGVFEQLPEKQVQAHLVRTFDGATYVTGLDKMGAPVVKPLRLSYKAVQGIQSILNATVSRPGYFDAAPPGVTTQSGFVYARDGELVVDPHSPDQRSTYLIDAPFDRNAEPVEFVRMLRACFRDDADCEEKVLLLQEFVGACLLGMATKYQKACILLGDGANGKSTVQEVIMSLFAGDVITAVVPQDLDEYQKASLSKSRLNVVNELPETELLSSAVVKALISGDLINARPIRQNPFSFRPRAGHLFAANALPGVRDLSPGFWRRWLVVPFNRVFTPAEQDRGLARRIIQGERAGLVAWAVRGAARLQQQGQYTESQPVRDQLSQWRHAVDTVSQYVEERLRKTDVGRTAPQQIYEDYKLWAMATGHKNPVTLTSFGLRLSKLGIEKRKHDGRMLYCAVLRMAATA